MESQVREFLAEAGCCWRCILIFLGESKFEKFCTNFCGVNSYSCDIPMDLNADRESNGDTSDVGKTCPSKKLRSFICIACLSLLQNCDSSDIISNVCNAVDEGGYDAKSFSVGISLPVSLGIRIHALWIHLLQKFPSMNVTPARTNHIGTLKDIWRNIVGSSVASITNKTYVCGQSVCLNIAIQADYEYDEEECLVLEKLDQKRFYIRRKQHRKFAEGIFTKQAVESTLKDFTDEQFLERCPGLFPLPRVCANYSNIQCTHSSIYFAGRYNKYSRALPQTPWFVEEERRFNTSVQELICGPLNQRIMADGVKFSASGREDVDVRCLGRGRPFVIEFVNPRLVNLTLDEMNSLQNKVNSSTDLVRILDLQIVDKKAVCNLKEGEEEKTKSYCALCFSPKPITEEILERVEKLNELTLEQMTPLRVLHRRPLSVRKRIIHSAKVEKVDAYFFKLYLVTQAGTYIKEFVHGDFGRTTPNLGSVLGVKCDIIALDVENVQLDWPPTITDTPEKEEKAPKKSMSIE